MALLGLLLAFSAIEHVLLAYGTGVPAVNGLAASSRPIFRYLNLVYLFLSGVVGYVVAWVCLDLVHLGFLTTIAYALVAFFLPLGLRRLVQTWIEEARGWERGKQYSISTSVVLMYVLSQYHLTIVEALVASLASGLGYLLLVALYQAIMARLSFESIPPRFKGLPLSLIVLGLIGLACLGLDAAMAPAFWAVFRP